MRHARLVAALTACALVSAALAGCQAAGASAGGEPVGAAGGAAGVSPGLRWGSAVSGSGIALSLSGPDGATLLQLACVRDPAELTVEVKRFRPIPSEERFSVGFGASDDPVTFVAELGEARPQGVEARAPITPELLAKIEAATEIRAVYGAQTLGPHLPPDLESAQRFTRACRQIAGR